MFENFKNKIVNVGNIEDKRIDYEFKQVVETLNNHNIEVDKFVDLFEKIELRTYFDNFSGFIGSLKNSNKKIWFGGILMNFVSNITIDKYNCYKFEIDKRTLIDQMNEIHNILNDNIIEKYEYKVNWLKNSKSLVNKIESTNSKIYGDLIGTSNKEGIIKNIKLVEYIDNKLGLVVDDLKLNKDLVKNKFIIKNVGCFVNGKNETNVVLKLKKYTLNVKFKGFDFKSSYDKVLFGYDDNLVNEL